MNDFILWLKIAVTFLITVLTQIFGGFDLIFKTLIICMTLDYLTGILCAIYLKKLNSQTGFKGIIKKATILIVVALASVIGNYSGLYEIRNLVIGFYIANEGISILENASKTDIPIMGKLREILNQIEKDK